MSTHESTRRVAEPFGSESVSLVSAGNSQMLPAQPHQRAALKTEDIALWSLSPGILFSFFDVPFIM